MDQRLAQALTEYDSLMKRGMCFHAHEVLEEAWIACGRPRGGWLQGAILVAVALTHWQKKNLRGATSVLLRAERFITQPGGKNPTDVPAEVLSWLREAARVIPADGQKE